MSWCSQRNNALSRVVRASVLGATAALSLLGLALAQVPYTPPSLRLGEANQLLQSTFNPLPEDMAPDAELLGGAAIPQETWIAGKLTNAQGKTYFLILTHNRDKTNSLRIMSFSPQGSEGPKPDPRMPQLPTRPITRSYEPGLGLRFVAAGDPLAAVDIAANNLELSWKQAGILDLHGKAATPSIEQYIPWREGRMTGIHLWSIQEYLGSGTIFGEPVTGFLHMDRSYDRIPYSEAPMWRQMESVGWAQHWVNEYDDHTAEMGVIMCGKGVGRGAIAANNTGKEIHHTAKFTVTPRYDGNKKLIRVDYLIDNEKWQLTPAPNGLYPDNYLQGMGMTDSVRVMDGTTARQGEKRKIVRSWTIAGGGRQACLDHQ